MGPGRTPGPSPLPAEDVSCGRGYDAAPFRPGPAARRGSGSTKPSSMPTRRRSVAGRPSARGCARPRCGQSVGCWGWAPRRTPKVSTAGGASVARGRPTRPGEIALRSPSSAAGPAGDHTRDGPAFHPLPRPFGTPPAALRLRRVPHRHPAAGASPMQTPTPQTATPTPPASTTTADPQRAVARAAAARS